MLADWGVSIRRACRVLEMDTSTYHYKSRRREQAEAENYRKMIVAMAQDVRVILIKLADRLHNMRTLHYMRQDKRARIAQETLDIMIPKELTPLASDRVYNRLKSLARIIGRTPRLVIET